MLTDRYLICVPISYSHVVVYSPADDFQIVVKVDDDSTHVSFKNGEVFTNVSD